MHCLGIVADQCLSHGGKQLSSRRFKGVPALGFPLLSVVVVKLFTSRNSGFSLLQSM
jgi:hypothetical protein